MAGRIPQAFLDELLARVDVVDLVDESVPLRPAGKEHRACCPFHHEKTPSFYVNRDKQFYHCFGCGAHGTAISWLMEYHRMTFPEAVEDLARRAGMEVPREGGAPAPGEDQGDLHALLAEAAAFYRARLKESPQAVAYLKDRGLTGESAAHFGLGYAPPGWDNLLRALGREPGRRRRLAAAGLLSSRDGGREYDRFRDRVMFPIHDRRGRVVGFGGRVLGAGEPKYLNSPETPVFHKGREVYGLHQALGAERRPPRLVLVEGYMDVVALHQAGIPQAVATLGTATTAEHLEGLFRQTPEVVFCFDGDEAGRRAAWRALEVSLPVLREGRQVGFVFLPEGEDPDSLVRREGADGFRGRLAEAQPMSRFLLAGLSAGVDTRGPDGRARLQETALPYLRRIPEGPLRRALEGELEALTKIPVARSPSWTTLRRSDPGRRPGPHSPSLMRRTIRLLLLNPGFAHHVEDPAVLGEAPLAGAGLLREMVEILQGSPHLSTGGLMEHFRGTESGAHLSKLLTMGDAGPEDLDAEAEFRGALNQLSRLRDRERIAALEHKERLGLLGADERREYLELCARRPEAPPSRGEPGSL